MMAKMHSCEHWGIWIDLDIMEQVNSFETETLELLSIQI